MFLVTVLVVLLYVNVLRYGIADKKDSDKLLLKGVELRVYKDSLYNFTTTPLSNPKDIIKYVHKKKKFVFITFGLNESPESPGLLTLLSALITKKQYNVVVLDWSRWAKVGPIGKMTRSTFVGTINKMQTIACKFGSALVDLKKTGINMEKRTAALIGHSLGAQMMAEASACAVGDYLSLNTLWGLDPAGGIYNLQFGSVPFLNSGVAKYVYIIHTDPDGFGSDQAVGTVDFWPNFSRDMYIKQPGCQQRANKDSLDDESFCNHDRSWYLFADGIRHPDSMPAIKAFDGEAWLTNHVHLMAPVAFIRLEPVENAYGQHFLKTQELAPFGLKMDGTLPITSQLI